MILEECKLLTDTGEGIYENILMDKDKYIVVQVNNKNKKRK
jgi:hypothetical protein